MSSILAILIGAHTNFPEKLFLQSIDAITGQAIGDSIHPRTFAFGQSGQSVAIDPLGRFVVFTFFSSLTLPGGLAYQALDATGHASGPIILLDENGFTGVDILKD